MFLEGTVFSAELITSPPVFSTWCGSSKPHRHQIGIQQLAMRVRPCNEVLVGRMSRKERLEQAVAVSDMANAVRPVI